MTLFAITRFLLSIVATLAAYMKDRQLISAGEAQELARNLEASNAILDKARRARDAATADFDKRDGVPDDKDPNLRD